MAGDGLRLALAALGLITWAARAGGLPVFFIPGQGGTTVRYCVLTAATAMFVLSAVLLHGGQHGAHPVRILVLPRPAAAGGGVVRHHDPVVAVERRELAGRTAQWLGGFYLLLAAIAARAAHLPLLPIGDKTRPALYRDAMAVVMVLAVAAVRLVFLPAMGMRAPFVVFYPAVMFAALYGGRRAGLLATVLSAILADYFWIEPTGSLVVTDVADWLGLVIFLLSGAMIAWGTGPCSASEPAPLRPRPRSSSPPTRGGRGGPAGERGEIPRPVREHDRGGSFLEAGPRRAWPDQDLAAGGRQPAEFEDLGKTSRRSGERPRTSFGPGATEHYLPVIERIMTEGVPFSFVDYFPHLDRYFRFTSVPLATTSSPRAPYHQHHEGRGGGARERGAAVARSGSGCPSAASSTTSTTASAR